MSIRRPLKFDRRQSRQSPRVLRAVAVVACAVAFANCSTDKSTAPVLPSTPVVATTNVCRTSAIAPPVVVSISLSDLATAAKLGLYPTELVVNKAVAAGDGIHFVTISAALAAARAARYANGELFEAACRVTISVAPGIYPATILATTDANVERLPMVIDVPKISVVGAFKMAVDATGRATGVGTTTDVTTILPSPALFIAGATSQSAASEEIFIVNSQPNGSRGDDAIIEGLVLNSGHATGSTVIGGQAVLSLRVNNLTIRGNRFDGNFTERVDLRASSATVERNYSSPGLGSTCDICIAGPGSFVVKDNRITEGGGVPGVLSVPATVLPVPAMIEQYTLPAEATVTVTMSNNEIRGHQSIPVGVGLRVATMGVGAPNVLGTSIVTMTNNLLSHNRFGIIVEAGFPVPGGSLRGDARITTSGNVFTANCQADFYASFARHATGLGLNANPYMKNATYAMTFGSDVPMSSVWYANPAGNGNTLTVNGATIPNGIVTAYDAAKVCP